MNYKQMFNNAPVPDVELGHFGDDYAALVKKFGPYNVEVAKAWYESAGTPVLAVPAVISHKLPTAGHCISLREAKEFCDAHPELQKYNDIPGAVKHLTPVRVAGVMLMAHQATGKMPNFNISSGRDVELLTKFAYLYCRSVADPECLSFLKEEVG